MKNMRHVLWGAVCLLLVCSKANKPPQDAAIGVNGEWIKVNEVAHLAEMLRQQAARFSPKDALEGMSDDIRRAAARQLIADRLMVQEAKRRKITFNQAQFDSLYDQFKQNVGGQAALTQMLTQSGQSEDEFRGNVMNGMLVDSLVRVLLSGLDTVDIAECKEYYDRNQERFRERSKVRTSQILFVTSGKSAQDIAKATEKAQKALAEAKAGKNFASLAKTYSEDPTAKSGGDIGWFEKGDMKPEIDAAIFALETDQVSEIVESDVGLHIFKKTGEKLSKPKRFHEVQQGIRRTLEIKKKNDAVTAVVDSLISAARIVYVDTALAL